MKDERERINKLVFNRTTTTVVDETKNMIKKRIESIEDLEPKDVENLIRIIGSLSYKSNNK